MTEKLSLGFDAWGQVEEVLEFDGDDVARVVFKGDNGAQMDANQYARNDGTNGFTESREMRKIIELDPTSALLIATMYGVVPLSPEFDEVVLRLCQDPDWRNLKTVEGGIRRDMVGNR